MKIDTQKSYNTFVSEATTGSNKSIHIKNKYKTYKPSLTKTNKDGKEWIDIGSLNTSLSDQEKGILRRKTLSKLFTSCGCAIFKSSIRSDLRASFTGIRTERILVKRINLNSRLDDIRNLAKTLNQS